MKLTICLLFLFCAFVAGLEQYSTDSKMLEESQKFCRRRLNIAMKVICSKPVYNSLKDSIKDTENGKIFIFVKITFF